MPFKKLRKLISNLKELNDLKERVIKSEEKERHLEIVFHRLEVKNKNITNELKDIKTNVRLLVSKLIK